MLQVSIEEEQGHVVWVGIDIAPAMLQVSIEEKQGHVV